MLQMPWSVGCLARAQAEHSMFSAIGRFVKVQKPVWTRPNPEATSRRALPYSDLYLRMVLVLYVIVAMKGAFLLEQPASSVLIEHDRMLELRAVVEVESLAIQHQ